MKILMVVAQNGFRDEEYFIPLETFRKYGHEVFTASIKRGKAYGKMGAIIDAGLACKEADVGDYDALVIVGGPGSPELGNHMEVQDMIRKAVEERLVLGAICLAPLVLARSGVLRNRTATVWNGDNLQSKALEGFGASYSMESVVVDGYIVTANGPDAAQDFADAIIELMDMR